MRQITLGISLLALIVAFAEPALAERRGVPGRRVGGGTRWTTQTYNKQTPSIKTKLNALTFAARTNLPASLKLKALYG